MENENAPVNDKPVSADADATLSSAVTPIPDSNGNEERTENTQAPQSEQTEEVNTASDALNEGEPSTDADVPPREDPVELVGGEPLEEVSSEPAGATEEASTQSQHHEDNNSDAASGENSTMENQAVDETTNLDHTSTTEPSQQEHAEEAPNQDSHQDDAHSAVDEDQQSHEPRGSVTGRMTDFSDGDSLHMERDAPRTADPLRPKYGGIRSNLKEWFNKRYLGGYRQKKSGLEYFHAETQTLTPQELRAQTSGVKFHRDTQTVFLKNRRIQTFRNTSTQMTKSGCFVSSETDVVKEGRRYVTSDEFQLIKEQKVIIIQCFVRSYFARKKVAKIRSERDQKMEAITEKERRRVMLIEKKRQKDLESRLHPKTVKDFEILYNGLENWRMQETIRINSLGYSEPARLAALADLLDQESALLQKIDRLKASAYQENREKAILKLLESMAAPKKWPCSDASMVLVDTPNTIRARELRDLYHALNLPLLSIDERLQILLHVKYTVKEFDCNLTREIVELIDREGDLVSRGRDTSSLEGLRKRISTLFLQFIKTPEFNPEATHYQKFPHAGQAWKRDTSVYYCQGCTKYKASTEFYLSTAMKHLGKCKDCTVKENFATHRKDDSAYGDMLKLIRIQEAIKRRASGMPADVTYNAMALLQESDMRYLIDVIWNRKSSISGSRNMEELILTRWRQDLELSPWNCILLTKAEAATHDRQPNPESFYAQDFWNKVSQKHLLARQHFGQLPAMSKYLKHHYRETEDGKLFPKTEAAPVVPVEVTV